VSATTLNRTSLDLTPLKARQQQTWSSGDFAVVASRIVLTAEQLADSAGLRAGWKVLDVATGSGNAAIAAARHGTHAVGLDYVPELLQVGRERARAEGLDVEFVEGDAENLPFPDDSFDATLSIYGSMFAPDHQRAAAELVRVTKPGGRIALASWKPNGFIGAMFGVLTSHVAPPPNVPSPMRWGTEDHIEGLFSGSVRGITSVERTFTFRFTSPDDFVDFFRRWYGPTFKAFAGLDPAGQESLAHDLAQLAKDWDVHRDGASVALPATYLESVITR
jgi:SAM-dependent methyltransferase